ncbi:pyrroloquinoline quinone-dependent dehydrogenase [Zobellia galactanivorans]|uniref:pyrroloquinoline quinone-dependent dehydrogenase n=1 Tax=Zobellia galactanivorans (strain DSM 12802 / CCUG 47099 / CIP 106680 / NCIMB 13871 / Dsij) TaxID=63186 RepID=UPI0026E41D5C|nr:pyrroloquinoline quinone-dependent dehydrogenase [Zobellia galactanivorans]MDO6809116.1 pyrroloquinoline quinone-dependent dehydrogenase [Zobellia galactanivorans]
MSLKKLVLPVLCTVLGSVLFSCRSDTEKGQAHKAYTTWSSYLGDPGRSHYTTLSQINKENVKDLKVAWTYEAKDWGQMQMNPLVVDSILYGVTAALRVVALNAETGKEIWQFGDSIQVWHSTSRGVSYWEEGDDKRILCTRGPHLYALDALTGKPVPTFGDKGKIDLRSGMPESAREKFVISNTPGSIFKNLIVMPLRLSEGAGAAPGNLMAFNVITGAVEWVFHTIPHPGEEGYDTWEENAYRSDEVGAANNWAGMAVDKELEIIYAPIGSAAPDFYGGARKGSNLYSDCLLALDANTGQRLWHFQFTHHDLWDRDPPAPPNLLTVEREGKKIAAVAQVTKQGYVYVFDRKTGEPLFDIEEVPVPASTLKGEEAWPSQPIPVKPKPFARQSTDITENNVSPYAENPDSLRAILRKLDKRIYAPPSLEPTLLLPGYDGAAEWGGTAADPEEGIIYVNSNEMPWIMQMGLNNTKLETLPLGEATYTQYCVSCHQEDRKGLAASGFPSLVDIELRKSADEVASIITHGKGMMTGFPQLKPKEKDALIRFLFNQEIKHNLAENTNAEKGYRTPYKHMGYNKFLDKNGLPALNPPWGSMHAIDLNTGEYIWSIALGESPELLKKGITGTGTENYGGPVVTENGLLFIAATRDGYFRVFDKHTGVKLWEYQLPAPAFATPAMYEVNGKQFIALACGGEKLGTKKGNTIIAFALE